MVHAAITGWGKCMPPAVLSNADLASIMDTDDEWITSRTGIHERRVSHVTGIELAHVAATRALACAGLAPGDVELIVYGSCSNDEVVPNSASGVQVRLGAARAAAMDVNTACTSFLYGLTTATAMIRTGVVKKRRGHRRRADLPVHGLEQSRCGRALRRRRRRRGPAGERAGGRASSARSSAADADVRGILRVRGMGTAYAHHGVMLGDTTWNFDGQEIFKRAVVAMAHASQDVLAKAGCTIDRGRPRRPAPGEPADHRVGRQACRRTDGAACSSPCSATATCRRRRCRSRWSRRWRRVASSRAH